MLSLDPQFLAGIAALIWFLLMLRMPVAVIIAFPLLFPFYLVRFELFGVPLTLPELLIYTSVLAHIVLSLYQYGEKKQGFLGRLRSWLGDHFAFFRCEQPFFMTLWAPVLVIFIGVFLSAFFVPPEAARTALGILKGWFFAPFLYLFLFLRLIPGKKSARRALEMYSVSALSLGIWGIVQWMTGDYVTPDMRVSGPFESANYLALYLAPAVTYLFLRMWQLFSLDASERSKRLVEIGLLMFGSLVGFFALYLTKSFGAFLGIGVGIFLFAIYFWFLGPWNITGRSALIRFSLFVLVFAILNAIFFMTGDLGKFRSMFEFQERSSSAVRLEVWDVSGAFLAEHPFVGIGPGQFQAAYESRAEELLGHEPLEPTILHPHNIFLMFWLSSGLLGLAGFLYLLALIYIQLKRVIPKKHMKTGVILGIMLVVILVHGLVDVPIWKNDLALQFWLITGALFRLGRR